MKMATFRLFDNLEPVEFEGTLLGEASSETEDSQRWTEIYIYKTVGGRYVLHTVGRSVLYHVHDGPCNTGVPRDPAELDPELDEPCGRCNPSTSAPLVDVEMDKESVTQAETAEGVYPLLLQRRGARTFMSWPATRAFEMASRADPALAAGRPAPRRVG